MLQIQKTAVFILLLGFSMSLNAQLNKGGETCAQATDVGLIKDVGSCPNGAGFQHENTATALGAENDPSCDHIGTNHDLWYSFVAPKSEGVVLKINLRTAARIEAAVYDGCGGNELICTSSHSDGLCVGNLVEGNTYYLQLWSDGFAVGSFDFCLEAKPSPSSNNDCEDAEALDIDLSSTPCDLSSNGKLFNNFGATPSGKMPLPTCGTFGNGVDTWFSVEIPAGGNITIEMTEALGPQDWAMAVYSGDCTSLTEIVCDDDSGNGLKPKIELTGRTVGEILLVRVWEFGGDDFGSFRLSAGIANVAPPSNDWCLGAIDLTAVDQANACVSPICSHNENATASGEQPLPSCGYFGAGRDVWYKVQVPMSGNMAIIMDVHNHAGPQDWAMAAYSGDCGDLTEIACDDDSGNGFYPRIDMINRTPGDVIYIRVWEYQGDQEGSYTICVTSRTPLSVELISFTGKALNGMNDISWVTASEKDMEMYNLQRSDDGKNWNNVYSTPAMNLRTEEATTYSFEDKTAPAKSFYRLESEEISGSEKYSNIIFLENKNSYKVVFGIHPQPASEYIEVALNDINFIDASVEIEIFNIAGSKVKEIKVNSFKNNFQVNVADLTEGVYIIKLDNGQNVISKKLIID